MANTCKYEKWKRYVSYDGGVTWDFLDDVKGELIEHDSPDCGYVPPNAKLYATYSDNTRYTVECNGSTTLTSGETQGHTTPFSSMTSAVIGDCVTTIGDKAFSGCSSLTSITIPNSVKNIYNAFARCNGLTSIGGTGSGASLEIPSGVTEISSYCFQYCNGLTSVVLPDTIKTIGEYVFSESHNIKTITIGSGVTSIGRGAFAICRGLTSITITNTTPPTLNAQAFESTNNCPIYVPAESLATYKAASGWSSYASRIQPIT